jgi:hypothetical protein
VGDAVGAASSHLRLSRAEDADVGALAGRKDLDVRLTMFKSEQNLSRTRTSECRFPPEINSLQWLFSCKHLIAHYVELRSSI